MDESEQALVDASQSNSQYESRISGQILTDNKIHGIWETRHARMLGYRQEHPTDWTTLEDILSEASEFWKERHLAFWIFTA